MTGSSDRSTVLWVVCQGSKVASWPAAQGSRVKDMAFSQDGSHAAVVLYDSSVVVFDLTTGACAVCIKADSAVHLGQQWPPKAQLIGRGERVGRNVHSDGFIFFIRFVFIYFLFLQERSWHS